MSEFIVVTTSERVTTIAMVRPEKKNALTLPMYVSLTAALTAASTDPQVRAVIITGTADCFSAGNDIGDFVKASQGGGDLSPVLDFLQRLATFDKPLVAAVAGVAIGIGTTLLLHCDLVYAAPTAKFRTPFVDLGLVPEAGSSLLLPALIGERRAAQMLLLGEQIDAPTAHAWGLINGVVDDALAAANAAAMAIAGKAPEAMRLSKAMMRRAIKDALVETMRVEAEAFAKRLTSPEAITAFGAMLTRQKPDFSKFE